MFNRFGIKLGFYSGEYVENNKKITGRYILGCSIGDITEVTEDYIYIGPRISNNYTCTGKIITSEYEYVGTILKENEKYIMHGIGTCTFNNGIVFESNFYNGKLDSNTKIIKNGKIIMEAIIQFSNIKNGFYILNNGDKISGVFNNLSQGNGTIERNNGDKFTGKFKACFIKDFENILNIKNLNEINFENILNIKNLNEINFSDCYYCKGILIKNNGDIIEGRWFDNLLLGGSIKVKYSNGDIYTGSFFNDKYSMGKLIENNGRTFEGIWVNEIFKGCVYYPNGDLYTGSYYNNFRNDEGILTTNNITYICNWENDLKNGKGTETINELTVRKCWKDDIEILEEQPINIKCPECRQDLDFLLSKCKILESYLNNDHICQICITNVCNINLPCQHRYCSDCIKLIR